MSSPANEQRPQAAESNHAPKTQAHQRRRRPGRAGPAADAAGLERTGPPEDRRGRAVGRRAHDAIRDDGGPQGSGQGFENQGLNRRQMMAAITFERAWNDLPACVDADPLASKTIDDLRWACQLQLDLIEEGQDGTEDDDPAE